MPKRKTLGNLDMMVQTAGAAIADEVMARQRQMIADLCKTIGGVRTRDVLSSQTQRVIKTFTPRERQTLERILIGDSEKQIARRLGVSPNTVHVYVKAIYRAFDVNSRGELMTFFVSSDWQAE